MKAIIFHPKAREVIRDFPTEVRNRIGRGLYLLQIGNTLSMPHARPMPNIAPGVFELRTKGKEGIYRIFYCCKTDESVLVFHAFMKKTMKTSLLEIELAKKRLKEIYHA